MNFKKERKCHGLEITIFQDKTLRDKATFSSLQCGITISEVQSDLKEYISELLLVKFLKSPFLLVSEFLEQP